MIAVALYAMYWLATLLLRPSTRAQPAVRLKPDATPAGRTRAEM